MKKRHRQLLERMDQYFDMDTVFEEAEKIGASRVKVLRTMEKFGRLISEMALGGRPNFTGETRVYKNGAIGFKAKCECGAEYWVTNVPYGKCFDCDDSSLFRSEVKDTSF